MTEDSTVTISFSNLECLAAAELLEISVIWLQHTGCNGHHPQVLHGCRQQAWHQSQHARLQGSSAVIHSHPSSN